MLNIILCGAPGSGKGTQSEFLIKLYGFQHLSTGDLLRTEIKSGSEFGKQIDQIISKGNLVSDDIMLHLIENYIKELPEDCKGVIYDGFPRTLPQAEAFEVLLEKYHQTAYMIDLQVEEAELISRILNRGKTSGRKDDLSLDTIKRRLTVYHEQTEPLHTFYNDRSRYQSVNGQGTLEDITLSLKKCIDQLL